MSIEVIDVKPSWKQPLNATASLIVPNRTEETSPLHTPNGKSMSKRILCKKQLRSSQLQRLGTPFHSNENQLFNVNKDRQNLFSSSCESYGHGRKINEPHNYVSKSNGGLEITCRSCNESNQTLPPLPDLIPIRRASVCPLTNGRKISEGISTERDNQLSHNTEANKNKLEDISENTQTNKNSFFEKSPFFPETEDTCSTTSHPRSHNPLLNNTLSPCSSSPNPSTWEDVILSKNLTTEKHASFSGKECENQHSKTTYVSEINVAERINIEKASFGTLNFHKLLKRAKKDNQIQSQNLKNMFEFKNNFSNQDEQDLQFSTSCELGCELLKKKRGRKIKTEIEDPNIEIPHRKSDRRRVARDIFLVFEEHPANRRSKGRDGTKGRQSKPKQKFGHLTAVERKPRIQNTTKKASSNVLLQVKTEPKPLKANRCENVVSETTEYVAENLKAISDLSTNPVARVNPIFLWVKQDDTRIVEVRCEDYDKRNRIRLTKTLNGWRAIPRTDPSSSRVGKLLSNQPVNIKQEMNERIIAKETHTVDDENHEETFKTETETKPTKSVKSSRNKKKKKKKKKKKRKYDEEQGEKRKCSMDAVVQTITADGGRIQNPIISTEPNNILVYESTNHERGDQLGMPKDIENLDLNLLNDMHDSDIDSLINQPNNVESTEELAKNLTQISDDLELEIPVYIQELSQDKPVLQLCPQTGLFIPNGEIVLNSNTQPINNNNNSQKVNRNPQEALLKPEINTQAETEMETETVVLPDSFETSDADTKNLKDLLDDADLLQHCSDNAMSGTELIDSLVKRSCEDNHISDDEAIKETICLDDFDNDDDEVLMQPEPVADIISRLGGSLTASPKGLSFNEAGEIEGLHGDLFQPSTQSDPFNPHTLEELSITIKTLEKSAETFTSPTTQKPNETTLVSPDSCVDEMPKDLTCKRTNEKPHQDQIHPDRANSRSSDAIQSPQPSGLPAVPPSPDIGYSKNKSGFLDQLLNSSSESPTIGSSITITPIIIPNSLTKQQKEPLDLGKHRKSASPTVSCSEEAKQMQTITIIDDDRNEDEPIHKRIKREDNEDAIQDKSHTENLIELLSTGKDPDPLIQLQLLIRNPEWKVPDPILVPKDRLSAILASPAREIPLLLTTRPELRLPEAFAYPAILKDPDILVISMAQLEAILQKQVELTRPKTKTQPIPQITMEAVPSIPKIRAPEKALNAQTDVSFSNKKSPAHGAIKSCNNTSSSLFGSGLATEIDAATLAAFNQMLWLPYLGQMAPDFLKAMAGMARMQSGNGIAELMPLLAQKQQQQEHQQQHPLQQQKPTFPTQFNSAAAAAAVATLSNPMVAFQNPLELAMWQEALSQAQMQRLLKLNETSTFSQRTNPSKKISNDSKSSFNSLSVNNSPNPQNASKQPAPSHHISSQQQQTRHMQQSHQSSEKSSNSARTVPNPFYRPPPSGNTESTGSQRKAQKSLQQHNQHDQKPRVTCKSLSNLLQPERMPHSSDAKLSNLMAMPGLEFNFVNNVSNLSSSNNSSCSSNQFPVSAGRTTNIGQFSNNSTSSATSSVSAASQIPNNFSTTSVQGKLKVKHGSHLIDPVALQKRLISCEDMTEVGSTTSGLDELMADPNAALWHPLFGNAQKPCYNSPWQWTTVTATGE